MGVDKSTASRAISLVINNIANLRNQFITMPESEEEIQEMKQKFYRIARFPKCIGAIDCTHVKIQSPGGENAELFRNRKGYFSFNVQVICDPHLKIQDVVCRWQGSAHDSTIFNNSRIKARLEQGDFGIDSLIIGDSGYPIKPYLITPLRDPQTPAEQLFNQSLIRTRNVVERCFGVLKRRFPVLSLGIRLKIEKVEPIVTASAVLHNIACQRNEPDFIVGEDILQAIEEANNMDLLMPDQNRLNIDNIVRCNLITQYFQDLL